MEGEKVERRLRKGYNGRIESSNGEMKGREEEHYIYND